jgi:hypothetical protein
VFGRDILFTYGPFGYLVDSRLYFTSTWMLAVAAPLAAGLLLAYSLLRLLQRGMGLLPSVLVAAPLLVLLSRLLLVGSPLLPEALVLVVLLWSFEIVLDSHARVGTVRMLLVATVAAAVSVMKLDAGLACLLLAGIAITVEGSRRGARTAAVALGRFLAAAAAALLVLWLVASQPVGALPDWLVRSVDVVRGYSAAMNIESGQYWEYTAAFLLIGTVAALIARAPFPGRAERWTALGLFAVVAFIAFKQGFVRHDAHVVQFFAIFAVLPLAFIRTWGTRTTLLVMIGPFIALCAIGNVGVDTLFDPSPRAEAMADTAHLLRSRDARTQFVDATRAQLRAEYAIPPAMTDRMRNQRAAVLPWELLVGYAYPDVRWHELPVFQTYDAYSESLDELNADALGRPDRPRFVLRESGMSIDGRIPRFESPAAALAMLCHYRTVSSDARWQLFQASADRCGAPTRIGERDASFGTTVQVPAASERSIVVARFHGIADGLVDEVRTLAYRARQIDIRVDSGPAHRFLQGHQGAFHVLTAPPCARQDLDSTTAQAFGSFALSADSAVGGERYRVEFSRIPFTC